MDRVPEPCASDGDVAVVVLTYNRGHLLRQCVERVLARASTATREIVIWDNGSIDGTRAYLESLDDSRLRVVYHPTNIGQNAYARAFAMTRASYLIELDDDMIDAPSDWDLTLLQAFQRLPDIGFLSASLVDDPHDLSARAMYRLYDYTETEECGVRLLLGPTGGGCAITSRELYDRVGGFRRRRRRVFFAEDAAYVADIQRAGYRAAVLTSLKLLHAGGPHYAEPPQEKLEYWESYRNRIKCKMAAKRLLLGVPGVAKINTRYRWFAPPTDMAVALEGAQPWLDYLEAKKRTESIAKDGV